MKAKDLIDEQNAAIEREQGGAGTSHAEREQGRRDNGNGRFCGLCA